MPVVLFLLFQILFPVIFQVFLLQLLVLILLLVLLQVLLFYWEQFARFWWLQLPRRFGEAPSVAFLGFPH